MSRRRIAAPAALVLLYLGAGAAPALTPEEVWTHWQSRLPSADATITVDSQSRKGDTLELTGVVTSGIYGGSPFTVTKARVLLQQLGDGAVRISEPGETRITIGKPDHSGDLATITVTAPDATTITSGTPALMHHRFDYPAVAASFDVHGDDTAPPFRGVVTLDGLVGGSVVAPREDNSGDGSFEFSLRTLTIDIASRSPAGDESIDARIQIDGLSTSGHGNVLPDAQMLDTAHALRDGLKVGGVLTLGPTQARFDIKTHATQTVLATTLNGGTLDMTMDADRIGYGIVFHDIALTNSAPTLEAALGELALGFAMPVLKSDVAGDFGLQTRVVDLTLSQSVWAMFDPGAHLPRDPATLILDMSGKAAWLVDILSPEAMRGVRLAPARLEALDLNQLLLRGAGAKASAKGALVFDNTDLTTWEGMPAPQGQIHVDIAGVNGLLDKAVAMGLIPADKSTAMRMGLAMFTRAGTGDDSLVSDIEFKDKGLIINGQRIR